MTRILLALAAITFIGCGHKKEPAPEKPWRSYYVCPNARPHSYGFQVCVYDGIEVIAFVSDDNEGTDASHPFTTMKRAGGELVRLGVPSGKFVDLHVADGQYNEGRK